MGFLTTVLIMILVLSGALPGWMEAVLAAISIGVGIAVLWSVVIERASSRERVAHEKALFYLSLLRMVREMSEEEWQAIRPVVARVCSKEMLEVLDKLVRRDARKG